MGKRKPNYSVWIEGRKTPIWNNYAKNKDDALKILVRKYGYKNMRLSKKENNYVFKTDNQKGIKSRFVEIYLKRK